MSRRDIISVALVFNLVLRPYGTQYRKCDEFIFKIIFRPCGGDRLGMANFYRYFAPGRAMSKVQQKCSTMGIYNKIKWVLGIFMVFFLIVATNLIDRDNFIRVKNSVQTIYEDRLIAQGLIFEFSTLIQEKEMASALSDTAFFRERNSIVNSELEALTSRYLATKLTDHEERVFSGLQADLQSLNNLESAAEKLQPANNSNYKNLLGSIKTNLHELSKIQLEEGRHQSLLSKEAIETVELFTRLEIYLLIFLAVLVQIIVIYKPKVA